MKTAIQERRLKDTRGGEVVLKVDRWSVMDYDNGRWKDEEKKDEFAR